MVYYHHIINAYEFRVRLVEGGLYKYFLHTQQGPVGQIHAMIECQYRQLTSCQHLCAVVILDENRRRSICRAFSCIEESLSNPRHTHSLLNLRARAPYPPGAPASYAVYPLSVSNDTLLEFRKLCALDVNQVISDKRQYSQPRINSLNGLERLDLTFSLKTRAVGPVGPVSEWQ